MEKPIELYPLMGHMDSQLMDTGITHWWNIKQFPLWKPMMEKLNYIH